jgi:hypothetical protein
LRYWQWLGLRLGLPVGGVLVFGVVTGIRTDNSGLTSGALIAAAAVIILSAIEVPLINYAYARRRRKALESSAAGTLFAADGSQIGYLAGALSGPAESRSGLRSGRFTFDNTGVNFRVSRNRRAGDTSLAWKQISRVDVTPGRSPILARLKVITTDGQTVTWLLGGFQDLTAALSQLQLGDSHSADPTSLV